MAKRNCTSPQQLEFYTSTQSSQEEKRFGEPSPFSLQKSSRFAYACLPHNHIQSFQQNMKLEICTKGTHTTVYSARLFMHHVSSCIDSFMSS